MFAMRALFFIILLFLISSCGSICHKNDQAELKKTNAADTTLNIAQQTPTTIQMNKSIILAEVLEIQLGEGDNYIIKVNALEVNEDPAYPSFASKNVEYTLKPAYGVDEQGKLLKNEINEGLLSVRNVKPGEKIKIIISMQRDLKWYLENVINKE